MTQNSVSAIASTPFTGLATQTYNVLTTGPYTVSVVASLPWFAPGTPYTTANPEASEVQTITAIGDTSGSLNNTYWEFTLPGNAPFQVSGTWYTFYYVWYNINSAGTDPAPAGGYGIAVAAATGASASTIGGDTRTAVSGALPATGNTYKVTGATTATILTALQPGATTAAVDTGATGFTFAVGTAGSFGYASGLVINILNNGVLVASSSQPSPNQASMGVTTQLTGTSGQAITVVTSSLSAADAALNAVKGIINIFQGPL